MKNCVLLVLFIISFLFGKKELTSNIVWDIHQHQYSLQKCPLINSIEWDASLYASGIYFIKLESGEKNDIQRLMLIK